MNRTGIILLVEDDKNIQRINRRILEREGFQVLCAGTLSEARELLQTHTPMCWYWTSCCLTAAVFPSAKKSVPLLPRQCCS